MTLYHKILAPLVVNRWAVGRLAAINQLAALTRSEGLYAAKRTALEAWGHKEGYVLQLMPEETCWGCESCSDGSERIQWCDGDGYRRRRYWLASWRIGGSTFHTPGGIVWWNNAEGKPVLDGRKLLGTIEGRITHEGPLADSVRSWSPERQRLEATLFALWWNPWMGLRSWWRYLIAGPRNRLAHYLHCRADALSPHRYRGRRPWYACALLVAGDWLYGSSLIQSFRARWPLATRPSEDTPF